MRWLSSALKHANAAVAARRVSTRAVVFSSGSLFGRRHFLAAFAPLVASGPPAESSWLRRPRRCLPISSCEANSFSTTGAPEHEQLRSLKDKLREMKRAEDVEKLAEDVAKIVDAAVVDGTEELGRDVVKEFFKVSSTVGGALRALDTWEQSRKMRGSVVDDEAFIELISHLDVPDKGEGLPNVERAWVLAREREVKFTPPMFTVLLRRLLQAKRYLMANAIGMTASREGKLEEAASEDLARAESAWLRMTYTPAIGTEVEPVPGEAPPPLSHINDNHTEEPMPDMNLEPRTAVWDQRPQRVG